MADQRKTSRYRRGAAAAAVGVLLAGALLVVPVAAQEAAGGGGSKAKKETAPGKTRKGEKPDTTDKSRGAEKKKDPKSDSPATSSSDAPGRGPRSTKTSGKGGKKALAVVGGGDISIDYVAAAQHTYNHLTGDGAADEYDGRAIGDKVVESLQGKDFACGDLVLWFAAVSVDAGAEGTAIVEIDFSWSAEPSGQPGAGFTDVFSVSINDNDSGNLNLDGNETATLVAESTGEAQGKQQIFGTIQVTGLEAEDQVIVAMLTRITCTLPNPTGNLFSRVQDARLIAPTADTVNVGAQTLTLKRVEDLAGLSGAGAGSITIVKNAVPDAPQDFAFSGDLGSFVLDDDAGSPRPNQHVVTDLAAGTYVVTEEATQGWELALVTCNDPSGDSSTSVTARSATIELAGGEDVVCTFRNERLGVTTHDDPAPAPDGNGADGDGDSDGDVGPRPATGRAEGETLPLTGGDTGFVMTLALVALGAGTILLRAGRRVRYRRTAV